MTFWTLAIRWLATAVGLGAALLPVPALAQIKKNVSTSAGSTVQLAAFVVPIRDSRTGQATNAPITVFLQLYDGGNIDLVCRHSPKLRDAFLVDLFENPIEVGPDRRMEFHDAPSRLVEVSNRTLGQRIVSAATVEEGARHMKTGGAKFARAIACGRDSR